MARRLDEGEASAASGAAEERRRFVCPPARGRYEGIELECLDPADPDAHRILLEAEHPLHRALWRGDDEVVVGGRPINPRLHIAMHEIVANQNLERSGVLAGLVPELAGERGAARLSARALRGFSGPVWNSTGLTEGGRPLALAILRARATGPRQSLF